MLESIVSAAAAVLLVLGGPSSAQEKPEAKPKETQKKTARITGDVVDVSALLTGEERTPRGTNGDQEGRSKEPAGRTGWLAIVENSPPRWTLAHEAGMRPAEPLRRYVGQRVTVEAEAAEIGGLRLARIEAVSSLGEAAPSKQPAEASSGQLREVTITGRLVDVEHLSKATGREESHTCEAACIAKAMLVGIQEPKGRLFAIVAGFRGEPPKGKGAEPSPGKGGVGVRATGMSVGQLLAVKNLEPAENPSTPEKPGGL